MRGGHGGVSRGHDDACDYCEEADRTLEAGDGDGDGEDDAGADDVDTDGETLQADEDRRGRGAFPGVLDEILRRLEDEDGEEGRAGHEAWVLLQAARERGVGDEPGLTNDAEDDEDGGKCDVDLEVQIVPRVLVARSGEAAGVGAFG